ncbi:uncharacterized protein [Dysidea avara]|uniref:uncharacterized protein n=1 Tax=Dysidea avara TaxID=196820 RepID=UPI0033192C92
MLSVIFIITVILTKELVMATEQCSKYQFKSPFYPGESCEDIYNKNPESHEWSGYYWITNGPSRVYCGMTYTGSSCLNIYNGTQWTFCNMTEVAAGFISTCAGVGGGWRRISNIDISTGGGCPSGWRKDTYSGVSFCRVVSDGSHTCSSTTFSTNSISYQRVCGRARGYQKGGAVAFTLYSIGGQTIDGYYVDGLSITHGNPRQHIWTFANGQFDNSHLYNCPCAPGSVYPSPPFVGTNYYCESGTNNTYSTSAYYFNDPLWDRSGCITSNCCDNPTQPWFYRELSGTTTDDIEARICREHGFATGSVLIDQLELYIL